MDERETVANELARLRRWMYAVAACSAFACIGVLAALVPAWKSFDEYATLTSDARATVDQAQRATARANAIMDEAEAVLQSARATMGATKATIQQTQQATEAAQSAIQDAPANILRSIPILNWFVR